MASRRDRARVGIGSVTCHVDGVEEPTVREAVLLVAARAAERRSSRTLAVAPDRGVGRRHFEPQPDARDRSRGRGLTGDHRAAPLRSSSPPRSPTRTACSAPGTFSPAASCCSPAHRSRPARSVHEPFDRLLSHGRITGGEVGDIGSIIAVAICTVGAIVTSLGAWDALPRRTSLVSIAPCAPSPGNVTSRETTASRFENTGYITSHDLFSARTVPRVQPDHDSKENHHAYPYPSRTRHRRRTRPRSLRQRRRRSPTPPHRHDRSDGRDRRCRRRCPTTRCPTTRCPTPPSHGRRRDGRRHERRGDGSGRGRPRRRRIRSGRSHHARRRHRGRRPRRRRSPTTARSRSSPRTTRPSWTTSARWA